MADLEPVIIFEDTMFPGVVLDKSISLATVIKQYLDYLEVKHTVRLELKGKIPPSRLIAQCAYFLQWQPLICDIIELTNNWRIRQNEKSSCSCAGIICACFSFMQYE